MSGLSESEERYLESRAAMLRIRRQVRELAGVPERATAFRVADERGRVTLDTDDWAEALNAALVRNWPHSHELHVEGTHPTHDWQRGQCLACHAISNGSYASIGPCGYRWDRTPDIIIQRELALREMPHEQ